MAAAIAALGLLGGTAFAQGTDKTGMYPDRPIRIVVPFTPGAINDVLARAMAEKLTQSLGQPVLVENRPGAGSVMGTDYVAKAVPDGYTLLQVPAAFAINESLLPKLPYRWDKEFSFISMAATSPFLLLVSASSPAKTVKDLVSMAQAAPGRVAFASTGKGGNAHLMGEMLKTMAKIDVIHVPYKGANQAITDLIGGQVQFTFSTYTGAASAIKAGRIRPLAVTSATRWAALPNLPTIAESGYPGYEAIGWWAYAVPARTPKPIIDKLNRELNKVMQMSDVQHRFRAEGIDLMGGSPSQARQFVAKEIDTWSDVVRQSRISLTE